MAVPDPDPIAAIAPDTAGHRARLRGRLLDNGGDALLDHELIEYLLALAIPRRDTKPLAKLLLREFGGIGGLLTADPKALARVPGMGDTSIAALKIAHAAAIRLVKAEIVDRPVLANWQALLDYLRADMAHHPIERVRVLHLNTRRRQLFARDGVFQPLLSPHAAILMQERLFENYPSFGTYIMRFRRSRPYDPRPGQHNIRESRDPSDLFGLYSICRPSLLRTVIVHGSF